MKIDPKYKDVTVTLSKPRSLFFGFNFRCGYLVRQPVNHILVKNILGATNGKVELLNYGPNENRKWTVNTDCKSVNVDVVKFDTEEFFDYLHIDDEKFSGADYTFQVVLNQYFNLRRPLRRKLRMRWFFDVSRVKESSFF